MTSEQTMTAEDARQIKVLADATYDALSARYLRILATYAECERLREELARVAPLYKDSLRYGEELRQLLAAAQEELAMIRQSNADFTRENSQGGVGYREAVAGPAPTPYTLAEVREIGGRTEMPATAFAYFLRVLDAMEDGK